MSENIITTESLDVAKKASTKKTPAKTKVSNEAENVVVEEIVKTPKIKKSTKSVTVIVFESGASYTSDGLVFTRQDYIQEVTEEQFGRLISLDNFRRPTDDEVQEYLASKED
jgi:hypothetical protein